MAKAGDGVRVEVQGDKQLLARLKQYRTTEQNKAIRKGLRAGAKIVQRETKARAPVGPDKKHRKGGQLKKSFKVRAMKRKRGRIGIMVQSGEGFFQGETFYSGFVALGHKVGHRRLGDARKQVPPNPFMQEAADKAAPEAVEVLMSTVKRELDLFASKK